MPVKSQIPNRLFLGVALVRPERGGLAFASAHDFRIVRRRHPESLVFAQGSCFPARLRALALAGLVGFGLAGCGRIGPLEPPGGVAAQPASPAAPGGMEAISPTVKPKIPPITPPNQPFILDPLLK